MVRSRYFQKRSAGSGKSGRHRHRVTSSLQGGKYRARDEHVEPGTAGEAPQKQGARRERAHAAEPVGRPFIYARLSVPSRALLSEDLSHGAAGEQRGGKYSWASMTLW